MENPEYIDVDPVTALVRKATCTHAELGPTIGRLFTELAAANPDAEAVAPPMVVYLAWRESDCDIEAAFPVDQGTIPGQGTELKSFPGCTAIFTTHEGAYSGLSESWISLWKYVSANNVDVEGAPWDSYVKPPDDAAHPESAITELYIPMR